MNSTMAAKALDRIRNDRTSSTAALLDEVNQIGQWLAQTKYTNTIGKLLTEAHQLTDRLNGRPHHRGIRIQIEDSRE